MNIKIHHVCIQTNTYQESLEFYTDVLGFALVKETKNFHGRAYNSWLKSSDFYLELQTGKENKQVAPFDKETTGPVHICFYVEDLEAAKMKFQQFDVVFLTKENQKIYHVENGSLFKIEAPEGTIIEFRDNLDY
ncbi:hypothetical protein A5821_003478 [Enterococcus sp. 7F3_DIV0205]|uniref:VOC domain-containing protein n=1 Tax=Candidatus Enterococcus palustris TaxID=1834189 RepID=A0AAQ3Y8G2_9ENTE|nr:VOC family protein [Enterococcus sp. 7F3_DIV0205]OTN84360.1 hypothetical protein A5821_000286 [Enterococcus sp. 7F3_DIV0205]